MTSATESAPQATDTGDMYAVHQVFRNAVAEAPDLVGRVPDGDTARSALIASYYDNVLRFLEVHHEGEDQLVTPRLLERCGDEESAVVRRVADQHHEVVVVLADCDRALSAWKQSAGPSDSAAVLGALAALGDRLVPHLDEEESEVLPIAAAHLSPAEWGELPAHGMGGFTGDNLWLIVGLIQEQFTDEQRQKMLANMPPPVADAWRTSGQNEFTTFVGEVRSTP